jgi:hypothetical protein
MPGPEGQHPPRENSYTENSLVLVVLKNPIVGDISYLLTYDGAHALRGSGRVKALGTVVGNIVVTRIG